MDIIHGSDWHHIDTNSPSNNPTKMIDNNPKWKSNVDTDSRGYSNDKPNLNLEKIKNIEGRRKVLDHKIITINIDANLVVVKNGIWTSCLETGRDNL